MDETAGAATGTAGAATGTAGAATGTAGAATRTAGAATRTAGAATGTAGRGQTGEGAADLAPRWLDEREDRGWRSFVSMQAHLRAVLRKDLQQQTGLSDADYAVLVHLSEAPDGRLRPFELGDAADWEKSRLSHHLTRMERRGLVERQICPSDSRGAFVALTPAGRAAIELAAPLHVEQVRQWFISALTPEQFDALTAISEAILARLEPVGEGSDACGGDGWAEEEADEGVAEEGVGGEGVGGEG